MSEHRFKLEDRAGKKKYHCPGCGRNGKLVRYLDTVTGGQLPEHYGRCDREVNCGYHLSPYSDGFAKGIQDRDKGLINQSFSSLGVSSPIRARAREIQSAPPSYIDPEIFKASRDHYEQNNFVKWLVSLFGEDVTSQIIGLYHLGTSRHQFRHPEHSGYLSPRGSCVFWQVDRGGKVRSGKVMLYDPLNGRRVKTPFSHITWVHRALKLKDFNLQQCFFGEHLLKLHPEAEVGIVESEKSALVAIAYMPHMVWLAAGSLTNLNPERCAALAGRTVYLFPDLNAFDKWKQKAEELNATVPGAVFHVSDLLERKATAEERESGLDIADYLIRFKHSDFFETADALVNFRGIQETEYSKVEGNRDSDHAKVERNSTHQPTEPLNIDLCARATAG